MATPDDGFSLGYVLGANQCNCPPTQTETRYQFVDNIQGTYTYQRSRADSPGNNAYDSNYDFLYDRAAGSGNSGFFPNRQVTLAQNYDVPFGKGRRWGSNMNRVADAALGGWEVHLWNERQTQRWPQQPA
jgi:hypothetical protein